MFNAKQAILLTKPNVAKAKALKKASMLLFAKKEEILIESCFFQIKCAAEKGEDSCSLDCGRELSTDDFSCVREYFSELGYSPGIPVHRNGFFISWSQNEQFFS